MSNKPSVNDGKGLYDNAGLCDTLIVDLNSLVKDMAGGQYVHFCIIIANMVRKIQNLKKGIVSEQENRNETIEMLKTQIKALEEDIAERAIKEKDGAE